MLTIQTTAASGIADASHRFRFFLVVDDRDDVGCDFHCLRRRQERRIVILPDGKNSHDGRLHLLPPASVSREEVAAK